MRQELKNMSFPCQTEWNSYLLASQSLAKQGMKLTTIELDCLLIKKTQSLSLPLCYMHTSEKRKETIK